MSAIFKKGHTAIITGGASGIGLALAQKCAGYGMRVLIADRNADTLAKAKASLGTAEVLTMEMDVGEVADWEKMRTMVEEKFKDQINLLSLNAGTSHPTSLLTGPDAASTATITATLSTNLFGVVHGLTHLLPALQYRATPSSPSAVVITGSKQGITNPPGNPAYNASKAAVRSLAEHLAHDLRHRADAIAVHLLVPGWTWTPLAGAAGGGPKPPAAWTPEQVVGFLEGKMAEGQFWVLCPDNDVTEDMDRKRMLWNVNDAVLGRPPLSRWRDEYKAEFEEWMKKDL
ncbi:hypothetical protein F5Y15DRAFT_343901 [Xylariaceae sp. FL0016]|nr:hypothetical protein F5Y15DRAFT_343901 [Xylariaceae sp. FL0016]